MRQDNVSKTIIIENSKNPKGNPDREGVLKVIFGHCDHNLKREHIKLVGSIFELDLKEFWAKNANGLKSEEKRPKVNFKKLIPYEDKEKLDELQSTQYIQRKIKRLREENEKFVLQ